MRKWDVVLVLAIACWLGIQAFLVAQGCSGGCREAIYWEQNTAMNCYVQATMNCFWCNGNGMNYCTTLVADNTYSCQPTGKKDGGDPCTWATCAPTCPGAPNGAYQEAKPCKGCDLSPAPESCGFPSLSGCVPS